MENQPGKLGIREYTSIAIFMIGAKLTDDTVALIYNQCTKRIMDDPDSYQVESFLFRSFYYSKH